LEREQYHLNLINPFDKNITYNLCKTAGNMLGFKHSDETKLKMSIKQLGNKHSLGHQHSNDTKTKMSNSHKGLKHLEKTKIKMIKLSKKEKLISKKHKTIKISDKVKKEVINLYNSGEYSTRKLSELYGISKSTIWNIVRK
jgi:group I intron endonuclease